MVDVGDGADGALNVAGTFNMHTDTQQAARAGCGDAPYYRVTAVAANTLTLMSAPGACLAAGDDVLLVDMQGRYIMSMPPINANVGNHETLTVATVTSAIVTLSLPKTLFYGDQSGSDSGVDMQKVFLQRVPNYTDVTVSAGGSIVGTAWLSPGGGGVLFFRASGTVSIAGDVVLDGMGYNGGSAPAVPGSTGWQGESRCGPVNSANSQFCSWGGGYGGEFCFGNELSGIGGAMGTAGQQQASACGPKMSTPYGALPGRLFLGSGGGGGANGSFSTGVGGRGGRGGGALAILASAITITGTVSSRGLPGGDGDLICNMCDEAKGAGGGGAGGSILLESIAAVQGAQNVHVEGGALGMACSNCVEGGGSGGDGLTWIP